MASKAPVMYDPAQREKLSGRVEVDEFFVGSQRSGKRDRGADGKVIVALAAER